MTAGIVRAMEAMLAAGLLVARLWGNLEPGPHSVGFRREASESAPGAAGTEARPIEIALWYPARGSSEPPLTFRTFFRIASDLRARSRNAPEDLEATLSAAMTGDPNAIRRERAAAILDSNMAAIKDAAPASGRFPIVVWSARYGTTAAQALLSEYLASHGFVVVFARPAADVAKLPFELPTRDEKTNELHAQVDDMRGALRFTRALPFAKPDATTILPWSYAGESAAQLQPADARVARVIGLRSNVLEGWVYQAKDAQAAFAHAPRTADFVTLSEKQSRFSALRHGNFNFIEGMLPGVENIDRVQPWSVGGAAAKKGYEEIARAVLAEVKRPVTVFPSPRGVEFESADGLAITADHYRSSAAARHGCILLMHQSGSSRGEYRTIGPELARSGFDALAMDVRWERRDRWNDVLNETAHRAGTAAAAEANDRPRIEAIRQGSIDDIDAGVRWLVDHGCATVILWGASIHANRAVNRAVADPSLIESLVLFTAGEYGAPGAMAATAAKLKVPALFLWGRGEEEVAKPVADAAPEALRRLHASPFGRHGTPILFEDPTAWIAVRTFLMSGRK